MNILLIFGIIVAILLMLVILIQNPKGGGVAANFGAVNQIFGVQRAGDIFEKMTWGGAIIIILISIVSATYNGAKNRQSRTAPATEQSEGTDYQKVIENAPKTKKPQ